jgi:hypothetical protein
VPNLEEFTSNLIRPFSNHDWKQEVSSLTKPPGWIRTRNKRFIPNKKTTGTNLETELPKIKHTSTPESFYLPPPTSISKPTNILKPFRGLHKRTHFLHPKPPSIQAKVYGNCRRRLRSLIFLQLFFVKHVSPIFFSGEDGAQGRGGRWMSGRVLVP